VSNILLIQEGGKVSTSDARTGPTASFLAGLGASVRRQRKKSGLTVQQLADAADLSRRMLTQIELGQANPSLVTVDRVARALGTDFASLTQDAGGDRSAPLAVNAPGSAAGVWSSAAGSLASLQVATQHHPPAELWDWTLQPGDRYQAQPDPIGSEELFLVITGTLTIEVHDLEPVTINAGGSARLASDRHYAYVNEGHEPVRFVRVVHLS
jgi:transcriptional regulator with XRE-family HTH domain